MARQWQDQNGNKVAAKNVITVVIADPWALCYVLSQADTVTVDCK